MSSFSRGPALRVLINIPRVQCLCNQRMTAIAETPKPLRFQSSRSSRSSFQISFTRRLSSKATTPQTPPKKATAPPRTANTSTPTATAALRSYAEQLARKNAPTILYEAPSHFWLRVFSFAAGGFCMSYAAINYWSITLHPPEGVAWWVPHGFAVICVFMGAMGGYFVLGTAWVVRSIRAVPGGLLPAGAAKAGGKAPKANTAAAVAGGAASPIKLEITLSRVMPLLPARKLFASPEEVILPFKLAATPMAQGVMPAKVLTGREQVLKAKAEAEARKAARKYELDHLMTAPFRHAGRGVSQLWSGARRALTREGFAKFQVKNTSYKLDITGGWALDNGRALDRLVSYRPNSV